MKKHLESKSWALNVGAAVVVGLLPLSVYASGCKANTSFTFYVTNQSEYKLEIADHDEYNASYTTNPPSILTAGAMEPVTIKNNTDTCGYVSLAYEAIDQQYPGCYFEFHITGDGPSDYSITSTPIQPDSDCHTGTTTQNGVNYPVMALEIESR